MNKQIFWGFLYLPTMLMTGMLLFPAIREIFFVYGLRWLYMFLTSFGISYCATPFFGAVANRFDIVDNPDARKSHLKSTPLLGGAAVFVGFIAAVLLNGICVKPVCMIMIASGLIFIIGVIDDIVEISAEIKMFAQLLSTVIVITAGVVLDVLPHSFGLLATVSNIMLTVIWVVGITNAMNFFDGMDGLATGLGAMISFFLGIISFQTSQPFLGWVSVAMMGGCLGFLPYNLKGRGRASIFLGDAGSTTIGFILACIAVYGEWSPNNPVVALVSPLLIFWVLIFDMVYITVDRILTGKVVNIRQWLEYVGQDHLHHRLAQVTGSPKKSVWFIYMMCLCLGISALTLRSAGPSEAYLLVIQAVVLVALISVLERHGRFGPSK